MDSAPSKPPGRIFDPVSAGEFIRSMASPRYLVRGWLMSSCVYTFTGPTGSGKTLVALLLAIRVSRGEYFAGYECEKRRVLFMAGENAANVAIQYRSLCAELEIDPEQQDIVFQRTTFPIGRQRQAVSKYLKDDQTIGLIIWDSLAAFFGGNDDNSNVEMLRHVSTMREIAEASRARPTSIILAHPRKGAGREELLPRGGGSTTAEVDGNCGIWLESNMIKCGWQGKWRGMPFDEFGFELLYVKPEGLIDARGDQMGCRIIRPLGPIREEEIRRDKNQRLLALLKLIEDDPKRTQADFALLLNVNQATVSRSMKELIDAKLVDMKAGFPVLTRAGKERLKHA